MAVPRMGMGGFTVPELMFACALAAVLGTLAVPAFRDAALNARRNTQVNELLHAFHAARGAAIRRGVPVVVCASRDGLQCSSGGSPWTEGWIVFANIDGDMPAAVDAGEPILLSQPRLEDLRLQANRDAITYWPVSRAGTTASFVFCDVRGPAAARAIVLSQTGRPRVTQRDSSGNPLSCAGGA